jgi:hypothetical protein
MKKCFVERLRPTWLATGNKPTIRSSSSCVNDFASAQKVLLVRNYEWCCWVTDTEAVLPAETQGHPISTHALVIDEIGKDENGTPIEILFGALAMQQ